MFKNIDFNNNEDFNKVSFNTPNGHRCTAYLYTKANDKLGSMVIVKIDDIDTYQFIHGMPKLYYYSKYLKDLESNEDKEIAEFREKLDGTNICLYKIYKPDPNNKNGHLDEVLDVMQKSRNMPLLHPNFQKLYDKIRDNDLEEYFKNSDIHSLMFELWGKDNRHDIRYNKNNQLSLLCGYDKNYNLLTINQLEDVVNKFNLNTPSVLGKLYFKDSKYNATVFKNTQTNQTTEDKDTLQFTGSLEKVLSDVENYYEVMNKDYKEEHNSFNTEGIVINTNFEGRNVLLKLKPPSIAEAYTLRNGIPAHSIKKEIKKYIDEYGKEETRTTFDENPDKIISYVNKQLSEEYKTEYIELNQSQKRIKRLIKEELQEKIHASEIVSIAEDLKEENPDLELKDLMKKFGQEYPEFKHKSRDMFKALSKLF